MGAAIKRGHGFAGSYSAVRRMLTEVGRNEPVDVTCWLDLEPGEAAQADFGVGPRLIHTSGRDGWRVSVHFPVEGSDSRASSDPVDEHDAHP